jgi:hypothetical protein
MGIVMRLGLLAGLALAAGSAAAQDLGLAAAQKLFEAKRHVESLDRLQDAIETVWSAMPLTVRTAQLIEDARGYGSYAARASNVFKPDDTVKLYAEPLGYGFRRNGDFHEAELAGDIALKTAGGQILLTQKDFARFPISSRRRVRELYLTISYAYRNLAPGDYAIVTTLRDVVSGKSANFEVPIKVAGPEPRAGKQAD